MSIFFGRPSRVEPSLNFIKSTCPTLDVIISEFEGSYDAQQLIELGEGSFGKTYKYGNKVYKIVKFENPDAPLEAQRFEYNYEPVILQKLSQYQELAPYLSPLIKTMLYEDCGIIVQSYIPSMDLIKYLNNPGRIDVNLGYKFIMDLKNAVEKLHARGIIHRDLKSENIIIKVNPATGRVLAPDPSISNIILIDFGLAEDLTNEFDEIKNTGKRKYAGTAKAFPKNFYAKFGHSNRALNNITNENERKQFMYDRLVPLEGLYNTTTMNHDNFLLAKIIEEISKKTNWGNDPRQRDVTSLIRTLKSPQKRVVENLFRNRGLPNPKGAQSNFSDLTVAKILEVPEVKKSGCGFFGCSGGRRTRRNKTKKHKTRVRKN